MKELELIQQKALAHISSAVNLVELDNVRVLFLGKKGLISSQMKNLGLLEASERPAAGAPPWRRHPFGSVSSGCSSAGQFATSAASNTQLGGCISPPAGPP